MTVGNTSFDDCERLTSSFGWTGFLEPIAPPGSSIARLEMTSLAFMFDCVPLPVCQTTSGKCASSLPSMTSSAARDDEARLRRVELAEVLVGEGGGLLHDAEGADDGSAEALPADLEVLQGPLRLRAPVPVGRDLDLPHAVGLDAHAGHVHRA